MLKKIGIGLVILIAIILAAILYIRHLLDPDAEHILSFIKSNPNRSSLTLFENDSLTVNYEGDQIRPLASTVKLVFALEYADQIINGKLSSDSSIALSDLEKFYVAGTDGGAHKAWLNSLSDSTEFVTLSDVVKGMMRYSSNANTEWLGSVLGYQNINQGIKELGIETHTTVYPIVSALFMADYLYPDLEEDEKTDSLQALSDSLYFHHVQDINKKLESVDGYHDSLYSTSLSIQKVWSDRLPSSTSFAYSGLMNDILYHKGIDTNQIAVFEDVSAWVMENPANQQWLNRSVVKGGSTPYVLTKALYAETKDSSRIALSYMLNDLSVFQQLRLRRSMNSFELAILQDEEFLSRIESELTQ